MADDSSFSVSTDSLDTLGINVSSQNDVFTRPNSIAKLLADPSDTRPNGSLDQSLSHKSTQNGSNSTENLNRITSNVTDQTGNASTDSLESYDVVPSQVARPWHTPLVDIEPEQDRPVEGFVLPAIPPSDPPTAQDWENHREVFTKLYRSQGRKLKDVKDIMEKRYGFRATYILLQPFPLESSANIGQRAHVQKKDCRLGLTKVLRSQQREDFLN
jgi:hypothetical protein